MKFIDQVNEIRKKYEGVTFKDEDPMLFKDVCILIKYIDWMHRTLEQKMIVQEFDKVPETTVN